MMSFAAPQKFTARLTTKTYLTKHHLLERFTLVNPTRMDFLPGQTVMLSIAPGVNRTMSISSPPEESGVITLIHDVAPMGPYSQWIIAAKEGDELTMTGPLGRFVMKTDTPRPVVLVATGSGIAPFFGMASHYFLSGGKNTVSLYWGLRHEEDIFWQDEFAAFTKRFPNFSSAITLSQALPSWTGLRGHVQDHVMARPDIASADYYLCGNKAMVADMRQRLKAAGVPDAQVVFELFY